jgi:predicted O-methyltransferase YrrM
LTPWRDVDGWLSTAEGEKLAELAAGKLVLELGAYKGRSTLALASTADGVVTIDSFRGEGDCGGVETWDAFLANLDGRDNVTAIRAGHDTAAHQPAAHYDVVFIDGSHDEASVHRDTINARLALRPGGVVAFHDWPMDSVQRGALRAGVVIDGQVETLAWGHFA